MFSILLAAIAHNFTNNMNTHFLHWLIFVLGVFCIIQYVFLFPLHSSNALVLFSVYIAYHHEASPLSEGATVEYLHAFMWFMDFVLKN